MIFSLFLSSLISRLFTQINGVKYEGQFENGHPHGHGTLSSQLCGTQVRKTNKEKKEKKEKEKEKEKKERESLNLFINFILFLFLFIFIYLVLWILE